MPDNTLADSTLTGSDLARAAGALRERLDQAHEHLAAADRVLAARVPGPIELHAAVDGAIALSTALASLVTTVMRQAPAALDHHSGPALNELLADLRAMHGCLTTGTVLLAPGRDDLHHLVTHQHTNTAAQQERGPVMPNSKLHDNVTNLDGVLDDATPANDVADQQRLARPQPTDDEPDLDGVEDVPDADPADVADQRRDAPVLDETEPWP